MSEKYVSAEDAKNGIDPCWKKAGRVHDWRNHVPEEVQKAWATFSPEHRSLLVDWADGLADREEWD